MFDRTPIAGSVEIEYHPAVTVDDITATMPASSGPPGSGDANEEVVALDAILLPVLNVSRCEQCGREFTPRRPWGRFCNDYCRRLAWLGRNPERATELALSDKIRLRKHIIERGGEWKDKDD